MNFRGSLGVQGNGTAGTEMRQVSRSGAEISILGGNKGRVG